MFHNYLKVALRNLLRHKNHSFINISGLAIGMACCIVIFLYVEHELSFDRFFNKSSRIFRLVDKIKTSEEIYAAVPPAWSRLIKDQFPEVVSTVRIRRLDLFTPLITHGENRFYDEEVWYADSTFFHIFDFEFIAGNPANAFDPPDAIVITKEIAQKYFGQTNPIGQTLVYNVHDALQVTGVVQVPTNTHLRFKMVRRFPVPAEKSHWWVRTYLLLADNTSSEDLASKLGGFLKEHYTRKDAASFRFTPSLQPVPDIHLHSNAQWELGPNGNITYVYLLSAIAVLILAVACINFMNLATARSAKRAREIGMRKVLGAQRRQLARQFLSESVLTTVLASILAVLLVEAVLPQFNSFSGKDLIPIYRQDAQSFIGLLLFITLVGLIGGSYPAVFLSGFQPMRILKGSVLKKGTSRFREVLVVFQFAISIIMLSGTGVIYKQLDYVRNKTLGWNKELVIGVVSRDRELNRRYESVKAELLRNPNIVHVSFAQGLPGKRITSFRYTLQGNEPEQFGMTAFATDHDYIKTLGIELLAGRDFSTEFGTDSSAFILNEAAVKALGWESPIGRRIGVSYFNKMGTVVGVVKDFHYNSLHENIGPAVLQIMPSGFYAKMAVRIRGPEVSKTLRFLEEKWRQFSPEHPFEYSFLDGDFGKLYRAEKQLGEIFAIFAGLAIFVACLGLFGLASFSAEQRTKEIGVRKILGATVAGLVLSLSKDFTKLVLIACVPAIPIAYFATRLWLQNFAYRTSLSPELFVVAGLLALLVSWLTVSYHTVRAALSNPVESLRYE